MSKGFVSELSKSRNMIPGFGWMVLIALVGFVYYKYIHKKKEKGGEDHKFHRIMKDWVIPITLIVVLTTLLFSNFTLSSQKSMTPPTNSYDYSNGVAGEAGVL